MLLNCGTGEDSWESLECKKIKLVNPKGNQHWIFIGKTDAEAPILWPPDEKCQLIGKDPDVGEDWSQNGEGGSRGWNGWIASQLNENEFEQTPGDSGGQRILVCYSPWDLKESDMTEWLNWTYFVKKLLNPTLYHRNNIYNHAYINK